MRRFRFLVREFCVGIKQGAASEKFEEYLTFGRAEETARASRPPSKPAGPFRFPLSALRNDRVLQHADSLDLYFGNVPTLSAGSEGCGAIPTPGGVPVKIQITRFERDAHCDRYHSRCGTSKMNSFVFEFCSVVPFSRS